MFRRLFSIGGALFLAGAMVFLTPELAQAQRFGMSRGGGWRGGGYGSGGWYGGGYGRGYYGGYRGGFYGSQPYYGSYSGYQPYYGSYSGYQPSYGSYYSSPYYGDYGQSTWSSPQYYANPSYSVPYDQGTPSYSSGYTPGAAAASNTTAHVTVRAPANARVWIGGWETPNTGAVREFDSPPLTPGKQYTYEVKAQWDQNGRMMNQTQQVDVSAGSRSEAVFPVASPGTASQASGPAR